MTKGRKTTYEERVELVRYCIEHEMDYAQTSAEKKKTAVGQLAFCAQILVHYGGS